MADSSLLNLMATLQGGFSSPEMMQQAESSDPLLAKIGGAGGFGFSPGGQWNVNWDVINQMMAPVGGMQWGTGTQNWHPLGMDMNSASVGSDASGNPMITQASNSQQNVAVGDRSNLTYVPGAGWVTPGSNIRVAPKVSGLENFMSNIAPMLIFSGLGAGFGSLSGLGSLGSSAIGAGRQYAFGQNNSPMSGLGPLLSLIRSLGGG